MNNKSRMNKLLLMVALVTSMAVPAYGQLISNTPTAWFYGTTCPALWVPLTPNQSRPASPDTYALRRPNGGPQIVLSLAALQNAWTVNGVLQQTALTAALTSGAVVSLLRGQSAQVRCTWRPVGGTP